MCFGVLKKTTQVYTYHISSNNLFIYLFIYTLFNDDKLQVDIKMIMLATQNYE